MKSEHNVYRESVPGYVSGIETGRDAREHIESCAECMEEAALLRALSEAEVPEPDGFFFAALPGRVSASIAAGRAERAAKGPFWRFLPVAAALMVSIVITYLYLGMPAGTKPEGDARTASQLEEGYAFVDPYSPALVDYGLLAYEDVPSVWDGISVMEIGDDYREASFAAEFAALSAAELDALYEALGDEGKNGGV